jgi:hypothetical protein
MQHGHLFRPFHSPSLDHRFRFDFLCTNEVPNFSRMYEFTLSPRQMVLVRLYFLNPLSQLKHECRHASIFKHTQLNKEKPASSSDKWISTKSGTASSADCSTAAFKREHARTQIWSATRHAFLLWLSMPFSFLQFTIDVHTFFASRLLSCSRSPAVYILCLARKTTCQGRKRQHRFCSAYLSWCATIVLVQSLH